ncbi:MAG: helix-turn-helix transcriptional regulator [Mangrovibacterium sp.]
MRHFLLLEILISFLDIYFCRILSYKWNTNDIANPNYFGFIFKLFCIAESISLNIKYIANRKNIQQKDIAQALKATTNTVNNWFNGSTTPKADLMPDIAGLLRVPVQVLFMPNEKVKKMDNFYTSIHEVAIKTEQEEGISEEKTNFVSFAPAFRPSSSKIFPFPFSFRGYTAKDQDQNTKDKISDLERKLIEAQEKQIEYMEKYVRLLEETREAKKESSKGVI